MGDSPKPFENADQWQMFVRQCRFNGNSNLSDNICSTQQICSEHMFNASNMFRRIWPHSSRLGRIQRIWTGGVRVRVNSHEELLVVKMRFSWFALFAVPAIFLFSTHMTARTTAHSGDDLPLFAWYIAIIVKQFTIRIYFRIWQRPANGLQFRVPNGHLVIHTCVLTGWDARVSHGHLCPSGVLLGLAPNAHTHTHSAALDFLRGLVRCRSRWSVWSSAERLGNDRWGGGVWCSRRASSFSTRDSRAAQGEENPMHCGECGGGLFVRSGRSTIITLRTGTDK
jgi:hypothetical protein